MIEIFKQFVSVSLLAAVFCLSVGSAFPEQCNNPTHATAGACCELAGSTHASLSGAGIGADCGCTLNEGGQTSPVPVETVLAETVVAKIIVQQLEVCQTGLIVTTFFGGDTQPVVVSLPTLTKSHLPLYTQNSCLLI